jgi:hydrogenase expression/formation protein HypE
MKTELPEIGKISPEVFEELIYPRLGAENASILVPPQSGVDVGIVEIGGSAVALTTDPVFVVPEYGFERAAWFAIHILLSDLVTSGLPPTYLSIDLNLPMSITGKELEILWQVIHEECRRYGTSIVTGHTARYENCHYPMVGGATVVGVGSKDRYVTPALASEGDKIIITKGPAIETVGLFAAMFPDRIREALGSDMARATEKIFFKMSVVEDARTAISVGVRDAGVTAMHDATECGIWGGCYELAQAAGLGMILDRDAIVVEPGVRETCALFGIEDPFAAISEGTLILSCKPHAASKVVEALSGAGIRSSVAGELVGRSAGIRVVENGLERPLVHPKVDPFWNAFYRALSASAPSA